MPFHIRSLIALAVVVSSFVLPATGAHADCGGPPAMAPATFGDTKVVDPVRAGGEPSILALRDGTLILSSHAGTTHLLKQNLPDPNFVTPYNGSDYVWRSEDGGEHWSYVGFQGTGLGPYSGPGFSDPTLAEDLAGNVYNAGIDLANVFVAKSADQGKTWLGNPVAAAFTDREWLAADEEDHVYMLSNDPGRVILESRDGGLTWSHGAGLPAKGEINNPITVDQRDGTLYHPGGGSFYLERVYVWRGLRQGDRSYEYGYVWGGLPHAFGFINSSAVDDAGNAYVTSNTSRQVFLNYSTDRGATWETAVVAEAPEGHAYLWPWVSAGADGRVAVAWLDADTTVASPPPPSVLPFGDGFALSGAFRVMVGSSLTAHGWTDACDAVQPPAFDTTVVTPDPIHVGSVCSQGVQCNGDVSASGDRRLGDYFTTSITRDGKLVLAFGDTQFQPSGAISHPGFVRQTGGVSFR